MTTETKGEVALVAASQAQTYQVPPNQPAEGSLEAFQEKAIAECKRLNETFCVVRRGGQVPVMHFYNEEQQRRHKLS